MRQGEILPESRQFRLRAVGLCASPVRLQHHWEVDPLAGSSWSTPQTVAGFAKSPPNARLMQVAADELKRRPEGRALDIGCGAARNAVPLARLGWRIVGTDLSWPMLTAARGRAHEEAPDDRVHVVQAPMTALPVREGAFDLDRGPRHLESRALI